MRNMPLKCVRNPALTLSTVEEDGLLQLEMVKVPSYAEWSNASASKADCKREWLKNCSLCI